MGAACTAERFMHRCTESLILKSWLFHLLVLYTITNHPESSLPVLSICHCSQAAFWREVKYEEVFAPNTGDKFVGLDLLETAACLTRHQPSLIGNCDLTLPAADRRNSYNFTKQIRPARTSWLSVMGRPQHKTRDNGRVSGGRKAPWNNGDLP